MKNYQAPQLEIIKLQTQDIVTLSSGGTDGNSGTDRDWGLNGNNQSKFSF